MSGLRPGSREESSGSATLLMLVAAFWLVLWPQAISLNATAPLAAPLRVLFVGNSLTYTHDLPAMVAAIAQAGEGAIEHRSVTAPNFGLSDHWDRGIVDVIEAYRADVVVLQQGPSSLADSRSYLVHWSERLDGPIRQAGGRPALFMVWPSRARLGAFDAVRDSYRAAAEAVDGLFVPAGEVWRELWKEQPEAALYGSDGFHPSELGSAVAAITIYSVLFDTRAGDLSPSRKTLRDLHLEAAELRAIGAAVDRVLARFGAPAVGASQEPAPP